MLLNDCPSVAANFISIEIFLSFVERQQQKQQQQQQQVLSIELFDATMAIIFELQCIIIVISEKTPFNFQSGSIQGPSKVLQPRHI